MIRMGCRRSWSLYNGLRKGVGLKGVCLRLSLRFSTFDDARIGNRGRAVDFALVVFQIKCFASSDYS